MPREHNFLLGHGERLTGEIKIKRSGGDKHPPYTLSQARDRMRACLHRVTTQIDQLPAEACPHDQVVAVMTIHPRYISKSDHPEVLLDAVGLRSIGSRSREVSPTQWGIKNPPESGKAVTEELFVAGTRRAFHTWENEISRWDETFGPSVFLGQLESIYTQAPVEKLRGIPDGQDEVLLEVALHNAGHRQIVAEFGAYAQSLGASVLLDRSRWVGGLTFVPVRVQKAALAELAKFTFLRVARGMPSIRPVPTALLRGQSTFPVILPTDGPLDPSVRSVIFDGGLPDSVDLTSWVRMVEPAGIGAPVPDLLQHGLGVTSAFLFGPLTQGIIPARPWCHVDHVRVLDRHTGAGGDLEYVDVLDRILAHLDANVGVYSFVNLSLGPSMPVDDDEVTAWTAALDDRFSRQPVLTTVAAGNDGDADSAAGLNRVQPPADGVNVLTVGSCDSMGAGWGRASYSCVGPGRSPGIVKPEGLAFGGAAGDPFMVLQAGVATTKAMPIHGTSFAAPFVLQAASSVRVQLGEEFSPLAAKALLIHRAEACDLDRKEVGWGRFEVDPRRLITCEDDEALVVFQGELPVGQHLRAPVPLPDTPLSGMISISATLVIAPEVDPEHPSTYTRSGLEVTFRPHSERFGKSPEGEPSANPKTISFFSQKELYKDPEFVLRDDGHKWEPCLHRSRDFRASSLHAPVFDIYYHHREMGKKATDPQPIRYALVISIRAPKVADLYNQVVRTYNQILIPLQPKVQVPVRV